MGACVYSSEVGGSSGGLEYPALLPSIIIL